MKQIKHGIRRPGRTSDLIVTASAGNYRIRINWKAFKADVKMVGKGILISSNTGV